MLPLGGVCERVVFLCLISSMTSDPPPPSVIVEVAAAAAAAKSLHSCPTLRDPRDGRTLEWVAISFSNV